MTYPSAVRRFATTALAALLALSLPGLTASAATPASGAPSNSTSKSASTSAGTPASAASAPAAVSAKDAAIRRVLEALKRGQTAKASIAALGDAATRSPAPSQGEDVRQMDEAGRQLVAAIEQALAQRALPASLVNRYDAWRGAALVIELKLRAHGERLRASADGAGHVARQEAASRRLAERFSRVRTLLDPVLAPTAGQAAPGADASRAALTEALGLLRADAAAQETPILRAQAVPFAGLSPVPRAPVKTPVVVPSYESPTDTAPAPADRAGSEHAPLHDEILAKATALGNDYVRIYEFVRNGTRNEWYAGSVKGALGTLRSGAGNDVDQASLLSALLRAAGLNTHYVQGVVELPLAPLAAELGLRASDTALVPMALAKAGVAYAPVVRGGQIAAVEVNRVWVSAYVPYTNYRGALVDASGKSWIPLDPFHKTHLTQPSTGLFERSFTAAGLSTEFLSRDRGQSFDAFLREKMQGALNAAGSTDGPDTQRSRTSIEPLKLDILPNSLPYAVLAVTSESSDLPSALVGRVRIRLQQGTRGDDPVVLDKTLSVAAASNARLSLSYAPATLEDHRVMLLWGGMDAVPLYLIGLRPQLRLDGQTLALGEGSVEAGQALRLRVSVIGPWGEQEIEQTLTGGANHALVIGNDPQRPTTASVGDGDKLGMQLLDGLGVYYQRRWLEADRDLAGWTDAALVRPAPAITVVSTTVKPAQVYGVSMTLRWTGVSMDAALHPVDGVGARATDVLGLSALAGSSLEQGVFRDQFSVEAMSADRAQQIAADAGVAVLTLDGGSVSRLDATDHGAAVKTAVKDLVRQGFTVRMPERRIGLRDWTGSAWQATQGTSAGYFLSGGLAGGSSAQAPGTWTLGFLEDAFKAMDEESSGNDPLAGVRVEVIGASSDQRGEVDTDLPIPFTVRVSDKEGRPVAGAKVQFVVMTGDAKVNGEPVSEAMTNELGMASAVVRNGTKTDVNAVFLMRKESDEYATQVGQISIDARVDSQMGVLRPPEPMIAYALPGPIGQVTPKKGIPTSSFPGISLYNGAISIAVEDRFGNPISNEMLTAAIVGHPDGSCATGPKTAYRPPTIATGDDVCADDVACGGASRTQKTGSVGTAFFFVMLGNEIGTTNDLTLSAGPATFKRTIRSEGTCYAGESNPRIDYLISYGGSRFDTEGNVINAALPGRAVDSDYQLGFLMGSRPWQIGDRGQYVFDPYVTWKETTGTLTGANVTNGGSALLTGGSNYKLFGGATPAQHAVSLSGTVKLFGVSNNPPNGAPAGPYEAQVAFSTTPDQPWDFYHTVLPTITSIGSSQVDPERVFLDVDGVSLYPIDVVYNVEPASYRVAKGSWISALKASGTPISYNPGDSSTGPGRATLPRSVKFDPDHQFYTVEVYHRSLSDTLKTEPRPVPLKQKLIASLQAGPASRFVDVSNRRSCDVSGSVSFQLARDAFVKVGYRTIDAGGVPTGDVIPLLEEQEYPAGPNDVSVDTVKLGNGRFELVVDGRAKSDPTLIDQERTRTSVTYLLNNTLPVGQTIVAGVNARSGILTRQSASISLPGRGPELGMTFSYSSSAGGVLGKVGANWVHNHDMGLQVNSCGEVTVSAGDSGTVRFYAGANDKMVPDKGYHGTLKVNRNDNSWDYYSIDGTQYHYVLMSKRVQWKLAYVKDRNGNTLTYSYDTTAYPEPLLMKIEHADGRKLELVYEDKPVQSQGATESMRKLLTTVQGTGDRLMELKYDPLGNLSTVIVNGRSTAYTYDVGADLPEDRHRLLSVKNPRGDETKYTYGTKQTVGFDKDANTRIEFSHPWVSSVTSETGQTTTFAIQPDWKSSTVTRAPGGVTTYTFNDYGSPLTIADAAGEVAMTWKADDVLLETRRDANGVLSVYTHDENGNLLSESTAGYTTRYTYEVQAGPPYSKARLASRSDRNGNLTSYVLDGGGNVTSENIAGALWSHTYSAKGDRLSTSGPNGNLVRFEYDPYGNLKASVNGGGGRFETERDERGRVTRRSDGAGHFTGLLYDRQDNLYAESRPDGLTRTMKYDAVGNLTEERDVGGRTWTYTYGKGSQLNKVTVQFGGESAERSMSYDAAGNKLSESDWKGAVVSFAYDDANRLTSRTQQGLITTYAYDGVGNVTSETTGGRTTSHRYDGLGRRTSTTDPEGKEWIHEYDGNGNKTASTDPRGAVTRMTYDARDKVTLVQQEEGRSTRFRYDEAGNLLLQIDPRGNNTSYTYDSNNRTTGVQYPDGTSVSMRYDTANNLTQSTDEAGGTTIFTYDVMNRVASEKNAGGYATSYDYNPFGGVTKETLPNGNVVVYGYDLFNRQVEASDSLGRLAKAAYDKNGNVTEQVDGNGNAVKHEYNALNYRTKTLLPDGVELIYDVNEHGNVLSATDGRGHATRYSYDKLNRVTRTNYPDGAQVDVTYDAVGNVISQIDGRRLETKQVYDKLGRVTSITSPDQSVETFAYDASNNLLSQKDARGNVTQHQYDARNRRLTTEKAGVLLSSVSYHPLGVVSQTSDANGNITRFSYDKRGLLTDTAAPEGATVRLTLNALGDADSTVDAEGRVTRMDYDLRGRLVGQTNPANEKVTFTYDGNDNRVTQTMPKGGTVRYVYGKRNWIEQVQAPMARNTIYARDGNGNLLSVTDPEGRVFSFTYDVMNRRETETNGSATQRFGYDKNGNLVSHVDALNRTTSFTYDDLDREVLRTFSGAQGPTSIATTYDANSNPLTVTENFAGAPSRVTTMSYDAFDRQLKESDGFGATMVFSYDKNGNRLTLSTQDGKQTRYGFDGLNRLTGLAGAGGGVQYGYDRSGRRISEIGSNGTATAIAYDAVGRRTRQQISRGATALNITEYSYDSNGNRLSERVNRPHSASGAQLTQYRYDGADRLTGTTRSLGASTAVTEWTYDGSDNRLSERVVRQGDDAGTVERSYSYDARSQLRGIQESTGVTTTLAYDDQGNLISKQRGAQTTSFEWDNRDLLISVSRDGNVLGRYDSNYAGQRIRKEAIDPLQPNAPPRVTYTQWDDGNAVQDRDAGGQVVTRYDFAYHQAIALWSSTDAAQLLHPDAMGSVVLTTGADGEVVSETLYDAWGIPVVREGLSVNKFAYTGHQADPETGLYYFKARYYDPELGRFISEDPADGEDGQPASYQRYLYAYANPLMYWDPDGRVAWLVDVANWAKGHDDKAREWASECKRFFDCKAQVIKASIVRVGASTVEGIARGANFVINAEIVRHAGIVRPGRGEGLPEEPEFVQEARRELDGDINAAKEVVKVVATEEGRQKISTHLSEKWEQIKQGDGGAVSDLFTIVGGAATGGPGAVKGAVKVVQTVTKGAKAVIKGIEKAGGKIVTKFEREAAREALEVSETAGRVVGEMAESTAARKSGQLLVEGTAGPGVDAALAKAVRTVEAEVLPARALDQPIGRSAGAMSVRRETYIRSNVEVSGLDSAKSDFSTFVKRERQLRKHLDAVPDPSGPSAYSVAFETKIPRARGGRREAHFEAANAALEASIKNDAGFAKIIEELNISLPADRGTSPANWTWHHVPKRPGVMQLVPRSQHMSGSPYQSLFHPGGSGGHRWWGYSY